MKTYLVVWHSQGNMGGASKKKIVQGKNIKEAQDVFLMWLQTQPVYEHLWQLTFSFEEVDGDEFTYPAFGSFLKNG